MGEVVPDEEVGVEIVKREQEPPNPGALTLFGTDDPVAVLEQASKVASGLKDVIEQQGLTKRISGREFIMAEGWTMLGSMLGVFPVVAWTRKLDNGWEARVEAVTKSGEVIGAAEAECLRTEANWKGRDDFALRSMAQTRAVSKALRMPLGFVAVLAGYEATPADEMDGQKMTRRVGSGSPAGATSEGSSEPRPSTKKLTKAELTDKIQSGFALLVGIPGWSEEEVLNAASRQWGRKITTLDELTDSELAAVADAMENATTEGGK